MAEINLLKSSTTTESSWESASVWVVRVLVVLAVGVVGYYGFLFFQVKAAVNQISDLQTNIQKSKQEALNMSGRQEFLVRQDQLKQFISLSAAHVFYSNILPAVAKVTLKNTFYTNISFSNQGKMQLQVVVPSLQDLDKFLQVFDQPDVAKDFYNVRLSGFSKSASDSGDSYSFSVQVDYNPAIISAAGKPK